MESWKRRFFDYESDLRASMSSNDRNFFCFWVVILTVTSSYVQPTNKLLEIFAYDVRHISVAKDHNKSAWIDLSG